MVPMQIGYDLRLGYRALPDDHTMATGYTMDTTWLLGHIDVHRYYHKYHMYNIYIYIYIYTYISIYADTAYILHVCLGSDCFNREAVGRRPVNRSLAVDARIPCPGVVQTNMNIQYDKQINTINEQRNTPGQAIPPVPCTSLQTSWLAPRQCIERIKRERAKKLAEFPQPCMKG